MKYAVDNISDADDALEYCDMARTGITRSLQELHKLLSDISRRTDGEDAITHGLSERARLIVEANLDF